MRQLRILLIAMVLLLLGAMPAVAAEETGEMGYAEVETFQSGSLDVPYAPEPSVLAADPLYEAIVERIQSKSSAFFDITPTPLDEVEETYARAINDHPEFFYAENGFSYNDDNNGNVTRIRPMYVEDLMTDQAQADFDRAVVEALSVVEGVTDPLEQALLLHDYLVLHVTYDWYTATHQSSLRSPNVGNAYGALVEGNAVCQGYALAYQLFMNKMGIPCTVVVSDSLNHAWNAVELDGEWYHVDATWDDPAPDLAGGCSHDYFLLSYDAIATGDHFEEDDWTFREGDSDKYESGYIFNGSETALYAYNGGYYYATSNALMYADSLVGSGTWVTGLSFYRNYFDGYYFYPAYAAVWMEGMLYYVSDGRGDDWYMGTPQTPTLCVVDLQAGTSTEMAEVPFTAAASGDGWYSSQRDTVGLMYDRAHGTIAAVSRTRPNMVLLEVSVATYPPAWDQVSTSGIIGWDAGRGQAGLYLAAEDVDGAVLIAARYENGRMVRAHCYDGFQTGLNVISLADLEAGDRLFLVTDQGWKPIGEALVCR